MCPSYQFNICLRQHVVREAREDPLQILEPPQPYTHPRVCVPYPHVVDQPPQLPCHRVDNEYDIYISLDIYTVNPRLTQYEYALMVVLVLVEVPEPEHPMLQYDVGGLHVRVREAEPVPQVVLHPPHAPQAPQEPAAS